MRRKGMAVMIAAIFSLSISTLSFASWHQNGYGWWYDNGDGTYPRAQWQWIDSDNDGVAECYCFNEIGYRYENMVTPDGYTVNSDGAWTVDGIVQVQNVSQAAVSIDTSIGGVYRNAGTGETAVVTVNEDGSIILQAECNGYQVEHGPLVCIGNGWYTDRWGFACIFEENSLRFVADGEHRYQKQ